MARVRTFVAVDLGSSVRDRIVSLQKSLGADGVGCTWVDPANLHVTLAFLGEVVERDLARVCRVVSRSLAGHPSFVMRVEGIGCFPGPDRPRVLWVGVTEGAEEVAGLHAALDGPLAEEGWRREERRFTAHVTLGRVKKEPRGDVLRAALRRHAAWRGGETEVGEVRVMSSELNPRGPVYTVLSRVNLD